jgi:crotonobetaine/carnitine-CoA ligase
MRTDSIAALLIRKAGEAPHRPFLVTDGVELSYDEMARRVLSVAAGLRQSGVQPGDRVALMLPNGWEFLVSWFALSALGSVMVPVNNGYRREEVAHILGHAEVAGVVCDSNSLPVVRSALNGQVLAPRIWSISDGDDACMFRDLMTKDRLQPAAVDAATPAAILYTSGTTGVSKGCVHGNGFYTRTGALFADYLGVSPADRVLTPLPLFHANAQAGTVMAALCAGATIVLLDRFHPTSFIESCRRFGATIVFYMGVMPAMLMTVAPTPSDRQHRIRIASGAGIPPRLHLEFEDRFGFPCIENYGMTETATVSMVRPGLSRRVGQGTVGAVCPGVDVRLLDEHGHEVAAGEPGHLHVRSGTLLLGYFRDPEATEVALADGWFRTGDLLSRDADGELRFLDRIRDVIRRSGVNISSLEIETILRRHPAVADAAVIGVPDDIRGEELRASIVPALRPESPHALFASLADHVADSLASFKVPRFWELRDALPRTPTLKTRKFVLRSERSDLLAGCWDRSAVQQRAASGGGTR